MLAFWDGLNPPDRASLVRQIEAIDFPLLRRLYERRGWPAGIGELAVRAESPPAFRLDSAGNPFSPELARQRGVEASAPGSSA